jgi:PAS domain S-box-containing protein
MILKEETTLFPVSIADLDSSRHLLKYLLNGVVFIDFLMAILVFYIFIVEIVRRVGTIADNSTRLAGGVPLNPPLAGSDEIQKLDGKFHDMAAQLAAARCELEASEKRIRTILGNVPTGVLVIQDASIEFGNVAAEKLFGFACADFQGVNVKDLFLAADQEVSLSESVEFSRDSFIELIGKRADGSTFRAEISSSVIAFADGERTLLAVKDVTERYELERLKREFTSMVCHDLRNPLASIRLFHDMLGNGYIGELKGPGPKLLANADRCIESLLALTNDMLELDRMDYASANSTDLVLSCLSLDTIIEKAVAFAEGALSAKQIQVVSTPSSLELQCDELKLLRVLGNLLTNAAKFSPEQSMIVIDVVSSEGMAKVSVTDRGRGIPASMQEAIFDKFKQVNLKDARIGSGLGLAICKKFVESHGGKIGVVSQPGEGSTFWFTVPVFSNDENVAVSPEQSLSETENMSDDLQINPLGVTAVREQIGVR